MKNNHLRMILCLFMCCALLFTCVAKPASATSVAVVAGLAAIPVAVAVATAFQALGVMSAANSTDFTTTVDSCSNWLTENSSLVVNGTVALLGLTNTGVTTSYLSKSFIQDIWEWLFSSGSLSSVHSATSISNVFGNGCTYTSLGEFSVICFRAIDKNGNRRLNYAFRSASGAQIVVYDSSGALIARYNFSKQIGGYYYSRFGYSGADYEFSTLGYNMTYLGDFYVGSNNVTAVESNFALLSGFDSCVTTSDVLLGQIQSPYQTVGTEEETIQIEIAPIYIDWTKYGVPDPNNPDGDPEHDGDLPMWLPTGIPSPEYDNSVITQNQQQAQSGVVSGDITFEPYGPDSGGGGGAGSGTDLSSVIQAIVNVPTAIVNGIGNVLSNFFGFNGNHEDYMVRLREFFPFCIPFDLYDFITVLSAEPEAPVFHWEIPVPQLGQTFELEVDLSAWDDIALLFRNLELLAFIFGLAIITREKFLRS